MLKAIAEVFLPWLFEKKPEDTDKKKPLEPFTGSIKKVRPKKYCRGESYLDSPEEKEGKTQKGKSIIRGWKNGETMSIILWDVSLPASPAGAAFLSAPRRYYL